MKILIVKSSAIGDVIQALPVAEYLKKKFPDCQIDWIVEKPAEELLSKNPHIDRVLSVETKKWRKNVWKGEWRPFLRALRQTKYDLLFDLQGNAKSGLFNLFARAKTKVGYAFSTLPEKINALTTTNRYLFPSTRKGYLALVQHHFKDQSSFTAHGEASSRTREEIMVCFGSNWENKQLSRQVLEAFLEKIGGRYLFIYGNEKEKAIAEQFADVLPGQALGDLTLLQWQKLMKEVPLIIAMDSAALHLAATTTTPTFSVFGPTNPGIYKPEGDRHVAFVGTCPYGQTFEKRCPALRTCSTGACMKEIDPEALFQVFERRFPEFLQTPQHQS